MQKKSRKFPVHSFTDGEERRNDSSKIGSGNNAFRPEPEINRALKQLCRLDNYHGLLALVADYATISLSITFAILAFKHLPLFPALVAYTVAVIIIGAAQRGFATILHEASHKTAAKSRTLNWALGAPLSGWWILQLNCSYTDSHVHFHHPKLGDPSLDPDVQNYIFQGLLDQSPKLFLARNLLSLAFGLKALIQLPYVLRHRLLPKTTDCKSWTEFAAFLMSWAGLMTALIMLGWFDEFLLFWVFPYLTAFQAIGWAIETSEHFPIVFSHKEAVYQTRNRHGNAFERFLTGRHGEWGHLIHHLRPGIPFWAMDEAHKIMLLDPDYCRSTCRYSGLFTHAGSTAPTIMSAMGRELQQLRNVPAAKVAE